MGKSIRSNRKKSLRSQRREKIGDEAVFVKSEACRAAAMAQCLAGPALPGNVLPPGKGEENMEIDESEERRSRSRSHSRGPGRAASSSGHEEMEDYSKSVRGPNQYKKQNRLKRGAKARLGVRRGVKKTVVRQHGLATKVRKPRFCKSSKKR